jgi:hypothetical protein
MYFKAFLISIFSDVCKIQMLIPVLASLQFQKVMIVVALIGLALSDRLRQNVKSGLFRNPQGKALLFFSLWVLLSIPLSVYPGSCVTFITENYWKLLITFCLVTAYVASLKTIDNTVWAIILGTAIFAVGALFAESGNRFSLVETYDPNENALLFVVFLPLIFWTAVTQRGWKKTALFFLALLSIAGVIKTNSRGGFLGLAAVLLVTFFQYRKVHKVEFWKIVLIPATLIVLLSIQGGEEYYERLASIFDTEQNYNYSAETGRIVIWKQGMDMMFSNPVLGVGVNQFISAQGMTFRSEGGAWQAAHNSLVQVGAELGIPGLLAFCFLMVSSVYYLRKVHALPRDWKTRNKEFIIRAYSLSGAWTGFMVCSFFLSYAYSNVFFLLLGLTVAFLNVVRAQLREAPNGASAPNGAK